MEDLLKTPQRPKTLENFNGYQSHESDESHQTSLFSKKSLNFLNSSDSKISDSSIMNTTMSQQSAGITEQSNSTSSLATESMFKWGFIDAQPGLELDFEKQNRNILSPNILKCTKNTLLNQTQPLCSTLMESPYKKQYCTPNLEPNFKQLGYFGETNRSVSAPNVSQVFSKRYPPLREINESESNYKALKMSKNVKSTGDLFSNDGKENHNRVAYRDPRYLYCNNIYDRMDPSNCNELASYDQYRSITNQRSSIIPVNHYLGQNYSMVANRENFLGHHFYSRQQANLETSIKRNKHSAIKKTNFNLKQLTHFISQKLKVCFAMRHDDLVAYIIQCTKTACNGNFNMSEKEMQSLKRRIYDTINVMEAVGLISRNKLIKKSMKITWNGFEHYWEVDDNERAKIRKLEKETNKYRIQIQKLKLIIPILQQLKQDADMKSVAKIQIPTSLICFIGDLRPEIKEITDNKIKFSTKAEPTGIMKDQISIIYHLYSLNYELNGKRNYILV